MEDDDDAVAPPSRSRSSRQQMEHSWGGWARQSKLALLPELSILDERDKMPGAGMGGRGGGSSESDAEMEVDAGEEDTDDADGADVTDAAAARLELSSFSSALSSLLTISSHSKFFVASLLFLSSSSRSQSRGRSNFNSWDRRD